MSNITCHTKEAFRVKVKKCESNLPPEWRKFSVDPQITTLEVLYSLLAKAFEIKSDFSIKYKAFDPAGIQIYLPVLSDSDLDAAFFRTYNFSLHSFSEPCLVLQIDIKPFTEVKDMTSDLAWRASTRLTDSTAREVISPLQQSVGQKYVQQMQTKLPGLIMNQMEKTFSMVQKAFNLNEQTMADLPPRPPLADVEFRTFLDILGQIKSFDELRKVIFFGGIDPSLRRVVWKHILNVYPNVMSGSQRIDYIRRKSAQYYKLRDTWKLAIKEGYVVGELAYVTSMVKKDVLRTDRLHPFYAGSDDNQNIGALFNILTTYALNHPSVSYCQGMSDIASPLLVTMNDEAQAYICFCAIMTRMRGNFMLDGIAMTQKFAHLTQALSYYDAEFWEYLKAKKADDLLFCYRWLLLELKREFPFEDALRMLEVQWSSIKYETSVEREELKLYEKEFAASSELPPDTSFFGVSTPSSIIFDNIASPISPSYVIAKQREIAYTKVCELKRQSSSSSLNSLTSYSTDVLPSKLDISKRLNEIVDKNTCCATRMHHQAFLKAHASLDESQSLLHLEGRTEVGGKNNKNDCDHIIEDASTNGCNGHETNPFKDNNDDVMNIGGEISIITSGVGSSSPLHGKKSTDHGNGSNVIECNVNIGGIKSPRGIAKYQNNKQSSSYNADSNIIAKQLSANGSESVKYVSNTDRGHFKDLKEKIAATTRKGLNLKEYNDHSQQKLVKNFNKFLNFSVINKSQVASEEKIRATILSVTKSKIDSPPHAQRISTLYPLVQLTTDDSISSSDSDSSSFPDTTNNTWSSASTRAIQKGSQISSYSRTPEGTLTADCNRDQSGANAISKCQDQGSGGATAEYSQNLTFRNKLCVDANNLDSELLENSILLTEIIDGKKDFQTSEIEYEKLDKDSLNMVLDFKEHEVMACSNKKVLQIRHGHEKSWIDMNAGRKSGQKLKEQIDTNLNLCDISSENEHTKKETNKATNCNSFLDESFLKDAILSSNQSPNKIDNCSNLHNCPIDLKFSSEPFLPMPMAGAEDMPAIVELATTAAKEEVNFFSKVAQISFSNINNPTITPMLPTPSEFGGGNPFLMFLCLTLLLQHRDTIMKSNMDYNEIAMHFDKMLRKHDVTSVLNQARRMYIDYLKNQSTCNPQQNQQTANSINAHSQPTDDVNRNAT